MSFTDDKLVIRKRGESSKILQKRPMAQISSDRINDQYVKKHKDNLALLLHAGRNISPRTRNFIVSNIELCRKILESEVKDERYQEMITSMEAQEGYLHSSIEKDDKYREELELYRELKLKIYLLKYGDYLASTCADFRKIDSQGVEPGFKGKTWSEVVTQAQGEMEEIEVWKEASKSKPEIIRPTTKMLDCFWQVSAAFEEYNKETVFATIRQYNERNQYAHSGVDNMMARHNWTGIATMIIRDLANIPNFTKTEEQHNILRLAVERFQHKFFESIVTFRDPDTDLVQIVGFVLKDGSLCKERKNEKVTLVKTTEEGIEPKRRRKYVTSEEYSEDRSICERLLQLTDDQSIEIKKLQEDYMLQKAKQEDAVKKATLAKAEEKEAKAAMKAATAAGQAAMAAVQTARLRENDAKEALVKKMQGFGV